MSRSLSSLIQGLAVTATDVAIGDPAEDSRQLQPGGLFVAVRGEVADGHDYAAQAVANGAAAVLAERPLPDLGVPVVVIPDLRACRGALAARYYGQPARNLHCVGVTGTNGKTSIAHYVADLATRLGHKAGYLGTIGWGAIGALQTARLTTEDPFTIQRRLNALADDGCVWAVLEVSSHALAQDRVDAVPFADAVFSNLSRDHLDYHRSTEAYGAAKARLFTGADLRLAVLNADDPFSATLAAALPAGVQCLSYGSGGAPAWPGMAAAVTGHVGYAGLDFSTGSARGTWHTPWGEAPLALPVQAPFSVANVAAALAVLCHAGAPFADVLAAAGSLAPVPGRMERFAGGGADIVVDFAHTPDALDKVLAALRPATAGRLICVFGCGGDRDPGKRPLMAAAAERHADELWLTSDNPRSEDPLAIIADMRSGLSGARRVRECADRREAIAAAVADAGPGDTVVIAGKGHEDYQEVNGRRTPFSDRAVVQELLKIREAC